MTNKSEAKRGPVPTAWLLFAAAYVGHLALRQFYEPGHLVRFLATFVLIFTFAYVVMVNVRIFQQLDEFQRQVQLLALGIAFSASLIVIFGLGFLRAEGFLQRADPRDLAGVMLMLYVAGLALAWRRYR